jgi:cobalt/nickel transport protein
VSGSRLFVVAGLLVATGLALFVSPLASSEPDGLERVAENAGFASTADDHALENGPVADYSVRGIDDERWSTAVSGLIGVLITFGIGLGVFALLRRRSRPPGSEP